MSLSRRIGAATALTAALFAGMSSLASAAPVTIAVADATLTTGQSVEAAIAGCAVGSTVAVTVNGAAFSSAAVVSDPAHVTIAFSALAAGKVNRIGVTCTPATDPASTASVDVYAFGRQHLESDPSTFATGETATITAGDFTPSSAVRLELYATNNDTPVFTKVLGTAGEDFSVTGDVVFPKGLACGDYDLVLRGKGDERVTGTLYMCSEETPTPTTTATVSPTVSVTPTATDSPAPKPTQRPTPPRLPSTGH